MPEVDPLRARIALATGSSPRELRDFATAIRAAESQIQTASGSVEQLSRNVSAFAPEVVGASRATGALTGRTRALGAASGGAIGGISGLTAAVVGTGAAMVTAGVAITKATREAAKFEVQVAELAKLVGEEQAQPLAESISRLGNELPVARDRLFNVAEAAARLGIRGTENITTFTRVVGEIGIATDLSADQAAVSMARLAKITQTPISEVRNLASAFNEASNTMAVSFSEVLDAAQRAAPGLAALGASQPEIAALAGSVAELSASSQRAGTRLNRIASELANPERAAQLARIVGQTTEEFRALVRESPAEAIFDLAEVFRSGGARADQLSTTLSEISLRVLRTLAQNLDEARASLSRMNAAFREGTSIGEEYNRFASTAQAESQRLTNRITDLQRRVGEGFLPIWKDLLETTADIVDAFNELVRSDLERVLPKAQAEEFARLIEDAVGATDEFQRMALPGGDRPGQLASRGFRDAQEAATELNRTIALLAQNLDSAIRPQFFQDVEAFLRANADSEASVSELILVVGELARDLQAAADDQLPPLTEALNALRASADTSEAQVDTLSGTISSMLAQVPTGQVDTLTTRLVGLITETAEGERTFSQLQSAVQLLAEEFGVAADEVGLTAEEIEERLDAVSGAIERFRVLVEADIPQAFGSLPDVLSERVDQVLELRQQVEDLRRAIETGEAPPEAGRLLDIQTGQLREAEARLQGISQILRGFPAGVFAAFGDELVAFNRSLRDMDTDLGDTGEAADRAGRMIEDALSAVFEQSRTVALAQGDVVRALENVERAGRDSFSVLQDMLGILTETGTSLEELEKIDPELADDLEAAAEAAGLTREEVEALLEAMGLAGGRADTLIKGFAEGFDDVATAIQSIGDALQDVTRLMEGLGVVSGKTADVINDVISGATRGAQAGAAIGGPIGAGVGAGVGILSATLGRAPGPAQQLLNELPVIVQLLGDSAEKLDQIAVSLGEIEVEKFRELRDVFQEQTIGDELEPSEIRAITAAMEELGLSFADLQQVARDLGIPIEEAVKRLVTGKGNSDLAAAQLRALADALGLLPDAADAARREFQRFADTLSGRLSLLRTEFELFDITAPADQLQRLQEELLSILRETPAAPVPGERAFAQADLTTPEGRAAFEAALQELFRAIVAGEAGGLGDLERREVIDLLKEMEKLLDRAADESAGAAATEQGFQRQNRVTQIQFERAFSLDLTRNSLLRDVAEHTRLTAEGVTGMDLEKVEVAGGVAEGLSSDVLDVMGEQLTVQTDIREILRSGASLGDTRGGFQDLRITIDAPISVEGAGDPEAVANAVQQRMEVTLSRGLLERLGLELRRETSRTGSVPTRSF